MEFSVNVISLFAGRAIKRKIVAQADQEFARLKEPCETPNAAAPG